MDKQTNPTIQLSNGIEMPIIGFGTAALGTKYTKNCVIKAIQIGYRHIDTAQAEEWYQEKLVGEAIAESNIPRQQLFITTKQHPRDHTTQQTKFMFQKSLENLKTNYILNVPL